jgi:hypothetical protein
MTQNLSLHTYGLKLDYYNKIFKFSKMMQPCFKKLIKLMCKKLSQFIRNMVMKNIKLGWVKKSLKLWKV